MSQGAANAKRNSPGTSSASSEGNDDAAMAVIMSLLEVRHRETVHSLFASMRRNVLVVLYFAATSFIHYLFIHYQADAGLGGPVDFSGLPWPLP